jgi:hypothetical protein
MKFSDWIKFKEEASASTGSLVATGTSTSSATTSPADSPPDSAPESTEGTTTNDVAKVPYRLGGCGFCFPHCSCSKCKRKKRKHKKKGKK